MSNAVSSFALMDSFFLLLLCIVPCHPCLRHDFYPDMDRKKKQKKKTRFALTVALCVFVCFVCALPFVEPDKEPARAERAECASGTKGWIWRASGVGAVWHCGEYNFLVTTGSAQENTQYAHSYSRPATVKHLQACTVEKFNFYSLLTRSVPVYLTQTHTNTLCFCALSAFLQQYFTHIFFLQRVWWIWTAVWQETRKLIIIVYIQTAITEVGVDSGSQKWRQYGSAFNLHPSAKPATPLLPERCHIACKAYEKTPLLTWFMTSLNSFLMSLGSQLLVLSLLQYKTVFIL